MDEKAASRRVLAAKTSASVFAVQTLGVLSGIVLARLLDPSERGTVGVVVATTSIVAVIGSLGGEIYARLAPVEALAALFRIRRERAVVIGALVVSAGLAAAGVSQTENASVWLLVLTAALGITGSVFIFLRGVMWRAGFRQRSVLLEALPRVAMPIVLIAMLAVGASISSVTAVVVLLVLTVGATLYGAMLLNQTWEGIRSTPSAAITTYVPSALPIAVGQIAMLLAYRVDRVIVSIVAATPDDVGRYIAIATFCELPLPLSRAIALVALDGPESPDAAGRKADTHALAQFVVVLTFVTLVLIVTGGRAIPFLLGPEYTVDQTVLTLLAVASLFAGVFRVIGSRRTALGEVSILARAGFVACCLAVVGGIALGNAFGTRGLSWSVLFAYAGALGVVVFRRAGGR